MRAGALSVGRAAEVHRPLDDERPVGFDLHAEPLAGERLARVDRRPRLGADGEGLFGWLTAFAQEGQPGRGRVATGVLQEEPGVEAVLGRALGEIPGPRST